MRIRNREYIGEIVGEVGDVFRVLRYAINPGLPQTFSWLSRLAQNFEQYKFHSLRFSYATERPTFTPGYILMATDYDAADPTPADKRIMAQYQASTRGAIYDNTVFVLDPKQLNRERLLYLRGGALAPNLDIKTYDAGSFFIASGGADSSGILGELWVDYDVELFSPQFPSPAELALATSAAVRYQGPVVDYSAPFLTALCMLAVFRCALGWTALG
jgi:hypothetical protein